MSDVKWQRRAEPVEVAIQWTGDNGLRFLETGLHLSMHKDIERRAVIHWHVTPNAPVSVIGPDWWLIRMKGSRWAVYSDIQFRANFEEVPDGSGS